MENRNETSTAHPRFMVRIGWTLILSYLLIALVPGALMLTIFVDQTNAQSRKQSTRQLESTVDTKTNDLLRWLASGQEILSLVRNDTRQYERLVTTVQVADTRLAPVAQVREYLQEKLDTQTTFNEFFLYTTTGEIRASTNADLEGQNVAAESYFDPSLKENGVTPPYYPGADSVTPEIISTQVLITTEGDIVGVLAGRVSLTELSSILTSRVGLGDTGETYLVSPVTHFLITPSRFEGIVQNAAYTSSGIDKALDGGTGSGVYKSYRGKQVIGVYRWIPSLQVAMIGELSESEALQTGSQLINLSLVVGLIVALSAAFLGIFVTLSIVRPLSALTQAAETIAAGDYRHQVTIASRNEIGVLARTFNVMTTRLRDLIEQLEARVEARTKDLQVAAQVSEQIATILDPTEMLPQLVELTKESFSLYHAHVYLLDASGANLVLAAGAGEAGRQMLARGHRIPAAATRSLVARAARENEPVIVANTMEQPDFLPNPLLPATRSEAAFPLSVGRRVLGVLDVQSEQTSHFNTDMVTVLSTLSDQVAIALDNARLFSEVERTNREELALSAITEQIQRATSVEDVLQVAVRELGRALRAPHTAIELHLDREDLSPDGEATITVDLETL